VDRVTLAALQATLMLYLDPGRLAERLPTISMIGMPSGEIKKRADNVAGALAKGAEGAADVAVVEDESRIGGGALPGSAIPTFVVVISPTVISADDFVFELRKCEVPIVGRISEDRVLLDLRTVKPSEDDLLIKSINGVFARIKDQERS
jgi:L-seryl-tRNA(Ser) seleniumtransferase